MITPSQYINIGGMNMSFNVYPSYYKPKPSLNDYNKGYIYRYFVQKINDLTITEVEKDKYNDIYIQYYNKIVLKWIISGPKDNEYINKVLNKKGVREQNLETLMENNKYIVGIKNYINNPLEFWGGK